jgi:hypothetical protein
VFTMTAMRRRAPRQALAPPEVAAVLACCMRNGSPI